MDSLWVLLLEPVVEWVLLECSHGQLPPVLLLDLGQDPHTSQRVYARLVTARRLLPWQLSQCFGPPQ